MIISETEFTARYGETDQMGIIHHSNYPVWFEAGRTGFFKKIGVWYSKIEEKGVLLPLTDLSCSYISPARYEDEIVIKTKLVEMSCVRLIFHYEGLNKDSGKLIATGATSHAWTDKSLKPLNIQKRIPELYQALVEALKD
ncbi:acyl-CoA thioesterase [Pseudobacteroides cellulosolvens]|uniref:4-hydroxybenzoyl-CoA thioesterase n=1 Tax=Pseudobacteroides cellulosolvens ATCC 35603 = DSM 2933 TaxID=398512 RepID=A0A0L6JUY5_9FIRM|nr:thioesterase family protein [Pseudobacteroides cellulosolvens]KNY29465.1 4-hydroxybenzoyl-CoA thioesterase [Pseudobacteroides cellulosolvens ATCC 35603 = DSM 2933]